MSRLLASTASTASSFNSGMQDQMLLTESIKKRRKSYQSLRNVMFYKTSVLTMLLLVLQLHEKTARKTLFVLQSFCADFSHDH